ncbi:MAG: HTTM domain-containing protein, partial [Phycisphaeraceae bacterium]
PSCPDGAPANRERVPRILTIASACILLQLALMYVFSGLYKLNDTWASGDAMRRSLSFDLYVKPVGEWMLSKESMLATVSRAMPWIEIIVPLVCFIPFFTSWFRTLAIIVFLALHIMIGLTMTTGLFPWVCMASWLLFVPTSWWNAVGSSHLAPRDGTHSPREPSPRRHLLLLPLAALFLFVLLWNTSNYQEHLKKDRILGDNWAWLAECTGLDQLWEMFREPPVDTGWYVITGTLASGKEVNLLTGAVLTTADVGSVDRPPRIYAQFPDHRWRKYLASLSADSHKGYRTVFANVWAQRWNADHGEDEQVDFIEVNYVREKTVAPGDAPVPLQRVLFLKIPVIKEGEANIGPDRRWRTGWE